MAKNRLLALIVASLVFPRNMWVEVAVEVGLTRLISQYLSR